MTPLDRNIFHPRIRAQMLRRISVFVCLIFCAGFRLSGATPETAPSFEWAVSAGGPKSERTRSLSLDSEGNIFLTGEATDGVKFGEATVKSAGGMDFFVAKLDPKGHFLWARMGGGSLIDRGYTKSPATRRAASGPAACSKGK